MNGKSRLRLGLIIDPEFYILEKSVAVGTPALIQALCRTFATRLIYDQQTFDTRCQEVDFLVSLEPKWAAPVLDWHRAGASRRALPSGPCYVMMSDPHIEPWREAYFLDHGLDYVLALYDAPTRRHFTRTPPERIVHFPWAVPDAWIDRGEIHHHGQPGLMVFGASESEAYTVRNWCRTQAGVTAYPHSGVEHPVFKDGRDYFRWLRSFAAVVAAGSEDPTYRLTTPKYFETAAAGSLLFAQVTDDLDRLGFIDGETCIVFSQDTFRERADQYLADPRNERWLATRRAGRELVRERHTIEARLRALDAHVRGWKGRQ